METRITRRRAATVDATTDAIRAPCLHPSNEYLKYCERKGWTPLPAGEVARQLPAAMLEIHQCRRRNDMGENKSMKGYSGVALQIEDAENGEGEEAQDEEG